MVDSTTATEPQTNESVKNIDEVTVKLPTKDVLKTEPNPLVICGPSGSGKSTILKAVMSQAKYKELLAFSVSHTTRKPRAGEVHGREYFFSDRDSMRAEIEAGKFIESAEFSGNLYGTSKESVHKCKSQGKICVLDIDAQGVRSLKKVSNLSPVYVFVKPPSMSSLEERLRSRKTETEESLTKRLNAAKEEIAFGEEEGAFDALIVNDDLDSAVHQLINVIESKILSQLTSPNIPSSPPSTTTPSTTTTTPSAKSEGCGDVVKNGEAVKERDEDEDVSGKKAKLESTTDSSRDSTPGAVER